jgi:putative Holliday junction resolvase
MPRILAIDHGTVRVGLALSDDMELVASPLTTLSNGATLIAEILRVVKQKQVGKIIVGLPMLMSGGRGAAAERTERFADALGKALLQEVPIEFVDERLSSKTAERALKREGHEINPKEGLVDQLAATVILQDYLNSQRGPSGYLLPDDATDMPWMDEQPHRRRK